MEETKLTIMSHKEKFGKKGTPIYKSPGRKSITNTMIRRIIMLSIIGETPDIAVNEREKSSSLH